MEFKDQIFNGKTIAEIFDQRGERVEPSQMTTGDMYLFEKKQYQWDALRIYSKINGNRIYVFLSLYDDGDMIDDGWIELLEVGSIFKATPDQIELLNRFKNENN